MAYTKQMPRDLAEAGPGSSLGAEAIQVLHPLAAPAHSVLAISGVSNRAGPFMPQIVVRLTADVDCFLRLGDATIVALVDDMPLWKGTYDVFHFKADTYLAAITGGAAGKLYITPLD